MRRYLRHGLCSAVLGLALAACSKQPSASVEAASGEPSTAAVEAKGSAPTAPAAAEPSAAGPARIGAPAPDFTLTDLDGNSVSLSQFRGKVVVLEWFNPGCPFVRAAHTAGSLKGLADKHAAEGVVWLAINSGGAGKQGAGVDANRAGVTQFGLHHPVLIDESGKVGQLYGAERTPHMFVVNPEGVLVYRGAIDNSPDGEGQSPEGGKLVNYVDGAIGAIRTGAKVTPEETKAYGCTVKYQNL
ncbi:MAG TPA: thioredoxin family protein [Polyangiaceae bacterium]|nr:thioredoxin family protein [Polyangiaceae bacterium]